jgi:HEPN domain-containing protein
MKPLTLEWVEKAEGDFAILLSLERSRNPRIFDGVCFHAQQCVEKYLKARLSEAGQPVPPIHQLPVLLDRVLPWEPLWEAFRAEMILLGNYAVSFRYPGESANRAEARAARESCRTIRRAAREALGLSARSNGKKDQP